MSEPHSETRLVQIAPLGERLSALRLCDATALATVRRSLVQHGQLSALTLFTAGGDEPVETRVHDHRGRGPPRAQSRNVVGCFTVGPH